MSGTYIRCAHTHTTHTYLTLHAPTVLVMTDSLLIFSFLSALMTCGALEGNDQVGVS